MLELFLSGFFGSVFAFIGTNLPASNFVLVATLAGFGSCFGFATALLFKKAQVLRARAGQKRLLTPSQASSLRAGLRKIPKLFMGWLFFAGAPAFSLSLFWSSYLVEDLRQHYADVNAALQSLGSSVRATGHDEIEAAFISYLSATFVAVSLLFTVLLLYFWLKPEDQDELN